jgi:D-arabinose 1-dehydrogenase-like Zn-dependent alcohol dehydrogenase
VRKTDVRNSLPLVVVSCGSKVTRFRPGDRVACENWFGSFAERMVAKASNTACLPDNADFIAGATVPHIYLIAWYALVDRARLQAGETVLVTGAAAGLRRTRTYARRARHRCRRERREGGCDTRLQRQ